jgi:hypothetical protein
MTVEPGPPATAIPEAGTTTLGAILAVPASLLVKAVLVDVDPDAQWLDLFLGDKPVFPTPGAKKPKRPPRHPGGTASP